MTTKPNIKIQPKTGVWKLLPSFLKSKTAHGFLGKVWLPSKLYKKYINSQLDTWEESIIIHEKEHVTQQLLIGDVKWLMKHLFSTSFRYNQELIAFKAQFQFLKSRNYKPNLLKISHQLSSPIYLLSIPNEKIAEDIRELWQTC